MSLNPGWKIIIYSAYMKNVESQFKLLEYIPYKFDVIVGRSAQLLAAHYKHLDITRPQFHVMAFVATYPGISPKGIIKLTVMDKSRVTRSIDGLVKKGLLTRQINPEDKRVYLLSLTRKGKDMYLKISTMAANMQRKLSTSLSEEEKQVLDRILIKMDGALNQIEAENLNEQ